MEKNENRWFVSDYYAAAGRPKMEDALMDFARKRWLYSIVPECQMEQMVEVLNREQARLKAENRRWGNVDVRLGVWDRGNFGKDDHVRLYVGSQNLFLRLIRREYEEVD